MAEKQRRLNPAAHAEQRRAANKARYRATQRLIRAHEQEYFALLAEEGQRVTPQVNPTGTLRQQRKGRVERLREEIAALEAEGG